MAKTKKQIAEDLKLIDVVVELLDARIPIASRNPDIAEITKSKQKVVILNKADLADEKQNQLWKSYFEKLEMATVLVDSNSGKGIPDTLKKIEEVYEGSAYEKKGRVGKSIRVMVLGIPNVGKSSFINRISKKAVAQVGNRPGVTRQKQWVRVTNNIELLDTPGVLWPKLTNEQTALYLAYTGTIKDDVLETIEIGFALLKLLVKYYKTNIIQRYQLNETEIEEVLQQQDLEENEKILDIMNKIGKSRGAIIAGGEINQERVASIILDDFRSGKLGKITLELVKK